MAFHVGEVEGATPCTLVLLKCPPRSLLSQVMNTYGVTIAAAPTIGALSCSHLYCDPLHHP